MLEALHRYSVDLLLLTRTVAVCHAIVEMASLPGNCHLVLLAVASEDSRALLKRNFIVGEGVHVKQYYIVKCMRKYVKTTETVPSKLSLWPFCHQCMHACIVLNVLYKLLYWVEAKNNISWLSSVGCD